MKRVLAPLVTSLLFAGSFVAAEYATYELEPLTTTFLRYLVAAAFLAALIPHYGRARLRVDRQDLLRLVVLGLTGIVGYHYFFFVALRHTEVTNTAIINATSPVLTGLMAALFIKERLALRGYAGIVVAVVGVLFLLTEGSLRRLVDFDFALGDLLMLCSVVSWVSYALVVKTLAGRYHAFTITLYATLFGVLALIPLSVGEGIAAQLNNLSMRSVMAVLYMGIAASGIGYLLYNRSIEELGPTKTSGIVYSLVPIIVAVLSWGFFGEAITLIVVTSTALVLVGMWMMLERSGKLEAVTRS